MLRDIISNFRSNSSLRVSVLDASQTSYERLWHPVALQSLLEQEDDLVNRVAKLDDLGYLASLLRNFPINVWCVVMRQ